ncbi:proteoglycan 4 isoform X3 [Rhipicephalus sanguineus]|uniref:proteoglycan 4 isoform X3 n=1 Tax=Rhipicephalus sanguineus TaxID=34632 RepID=UPI001894CD07|nr:proteoglycan 4 isoform X3 [Rhipicephalus sanguineus]
MDKSHGCGECCEKWSEKYITFKKKLVQRSHQIVRYLQLEQENKKLKEKLLDMRELSQTLRADCDGYKNEVCAKMAELDSLKKLASSHSATLAHLNQERDEARKAQQEAQTSLESCQATLKQYQALIEQQQEQAKAQSRSKSQENRVSMLEKRLQTCTQQAKQARSQNKKAVGLLRSFVELLRHPESWTSAKLQQQVERLTSLLQAEDGDFQFGSCQLEAFLEACASSTQELSRNELIARIREMQIPNPLSPLPPSPEPYSSYVPDLEPLVSSVPSVPLSASSEMLPSAPSPMLRPSTEPSDHLPQVPSSEKMQLECLSELAPDMPVSDALPGLAPPALSSEVPVLPTAPHDTTSQVNLLESVSLLPNSEALKEASLSEPLSDVILPALMPLAPTLDPVRLAPAASSSESSVSSLHLAVSLSEPASPPVSLVQPASVIALLEPTSAIVVPEPRAPVPSLEQAPVPIIALSKPVQPASLVPAPPASSLDKALVVALSEQPPSLEETASVMAPLELTSPVASSLEPEPAQPTSSMDQESASVIALSKPAPPPPSLEKPASVTAESEPALPVSALKPEPTSAIITSEPAPPTSLLEHEAASVIALSQPEQLASLKPVPISVIDLSESVPPASSLEQEPASVITLSESAPPPSSSEETAPVVAFSKSASPVALLKPKPTLVIALPEPAPLISSLEQEPATTTALSEPAPAVFPRKPVRTSVIVLSEPALPVSLKAKPTSVIPLSESAPSASSSVIALLEPVAPVSSLQQEPVSGTVVPESALPVFSFKPEPTLVVGLSEPAPPASSLKREPASVIALSEPLLEAALKPVPTGSEPLPHVSSLEPLVTSVIALSKLAPQKSLFKPVMAENTSVLPLASSSLDLKPPVLLSKPVVMTPSLELVSPLPPKLVQQSMLAPLPTLSEPVSLTPLEPKLPTPESKPAYKGLISLASDHKSWRAVSTTRDIPSGPEQQLCVQPMEERQTGKELSEACKPLIDGAGQEQLASQEVLQSSQVAELPKRKQWLARKRQSMDQPLVASELKQEQPQDSEKVHGGPTSKKLRLSKQQLRELFSSSSEDEEVAEENTYTAFLASTEHAALCKAVSGKLLSAKAARTAMSKLSWLAMQPEVRPGVVASFVRNVKRDALIHAALLYLARTKANPVAAYCRGEQSPPLITKLETLLLDALALKTNGWAALLSSLRARLWSPQQPTQMLAQASYVRLVCTLCSHLKEHKLALVTAWDLVCSSHAPFLVASAVGAWPGLLSALPPGPLQKAIGYILLRSPAHSLNSTLQSQAYRTLCELGPLQEYEGDERALVEELLGPLLSPHQPCRDVCVTHCLALEQLCRRSPVGLLTWLLEERLGPHVQPLLRQPNAVCFVRLLGSLWKHYEKAAVKLDTMLCEIASSLCHQEPTLREAIVQALLLLPGLKGSHWSDYLLDWQQSS